MRLALKLLICIVFINYNAKAQYVEIPDSNFRSFLKSNFTSCFNVSDLMDTACTALLPGTTMTVPYQLHVHNLEGIQYFKKIETI